LRILKRQPGSPSSCRVARLSRSSASSTKQRNRERVDPCPAASSEGCGIEPVTGRVRRCSGRCEDQRISTPIFLHLVLQTGRRAPPFTETHRRHDCGTPSPSGYRLSGQFPESRDSGGDPQVRRRDLPELAARRYVPAARAGVSKRRFRRGIGPGRARRARARRIYASGADDPALIEAG
jgi:hypothetical protein